MVTFLFYQCYVYMQALWFLSHAPMAPTLLLMSEVYRMRESAWPALQENFAGYLIHLESVYVHRLKYAFCAVFLDEFKGLLFCF